MPSNVVPSDKVENCKIVKLNKDFLTGISSLPCVGRLKILKEDF